MLQAMYRSQDGLDGPRGQEISQKNVLQLGKGRPPRAPPAREAAVAPTAGGCRPPNPPLRKMFLIFDLFLGGARKCFGPHFAAITIIISKAIGKSLISKIQIARN